MSNGGLKPTFTLQDVEGFFNESFRRTNEALLQTFQFAGESFVREARLKTANEGGFNDITGNLRSSIGYILLNNGKQVMSNFAEANIGTDRATGVSQGELVADEYGSNYPKGLILICVAGMDYAAAVEAKGKDVISGTSVDTIKLLKQLLSAL